MIKTLTLRSLAVAATLAMLAVADSAAAQTATGPAAPQEPGVQAAAPRQERAAPRREPRRRREVISQEEISESRATNLYEVVQRLRPDWLRGAGPSNLGGGGTAIVVYQNNTPLGGLDALRQMSPGYAEALRYLDGSTASNTLPGLGSRRVAGAIVVMTPGGR
ncbi:MAG TPA: hypothetical protein VF006_04270 [Longimicrobium sp.]